jgi:hypothetical protein
VLLCGSTFRFDPEVSPKPKKLPTGILSWIAPTLFYDEGEMLKTAGMDVVVMVRLLSYGEWLVNDGQQHTFDYG